MTNKKVLLIVCTTLLFGSCVTQKKFDELLAERVRLEADYNDLEDRMTAATEKIDKLEKQVKEMEKENTTKTSTISKLETDLKALQEEHAQLETYYNNLLNNSGKLTRDIAEQQERLLTLQQSLDTKIKENEALLADLEEREQRVNSLEKLIAEQEKTVDELMASVKEALLNFAGNDLSVEVKNGKVYVSMAEQLLFQSGSYDVDPKGKQALIQLASALKSSPDINILVEGHTDSVPISTKFIKDNWDLSVMRATSITRILTGADVDPTRLTAAGRSKYLPVTTNTTTEGKQENRRTEIILAPDLDELFQMLETD